MGRRVCVLLTALLAVLGLAAPATASADEPPVFSVLMLTPADRSVPSVVRAEQTLDIMGRTYGLRVDLVHDDTAFTAEKLAAYQVVLWVGVRGDVLGETAQQALSAYVDGGGGFAGVTAASINAEPDWSWYGELVGTRLAPGSGPNVKHNVTVTSGTPTSSASANVSKAFDLTDQWFEPETDPGTLPGFTSMASYRNSANQEVSSAWTHLRGQGRAAFMSMGNDYDIWGEGDFTKLVRDQLWWASGSTAPILVRTDSSAPPWPYVLSFVVWILAIVAGGVIAVSRSTREPVRSRGLTSEAG